VVAQPPLLAGKDEWRDWARATRVELDFAELSDQVRSHLEQWAPLQQASVALVYLPLADEINLVALQATELGCRFVATRTPDREGALTVHELGGPLEVHRFGFLQPHRAAPEVDPGDIDVLLLPGLAFDLWGTRLGRGAGYFDELLSRLPGRAVTVGVCPAALVVDRLPHEPHDQKVQFLATDEGVIATA
jgi:5-formyltetrahydrofolate cyclo-ligase